MPEVMEAGAGLGIRKPESTVLDGIPAVERTKTDEHLSRIRSGVEDLARKEPEYEGEPNTEGLQICDHCGNPSQYLYSAEARTRIYCSDHCRKAESNQA